MLVVSRVRKARWRRRRRRGSTSKPFEEENIHLPDELFPAAIASKASTSKRKAPDDDPSKQTSKKPKRLHTRRDLLIVGYAFRFIYLYRQSDKRLIYFLNRDYNRSRTNRIVTNPREDSPLHLLLLRQLEARSISSCIKVLLERWKTTIKNLGTIQKNW
jgi:hypothetical protein